MCIETIYYIVFTLLSSTELALYKFKFLWQLYSISVQEHNNCENT
jgi:hypothetical protein